MNLLVLIAYEDRASVAGVHFNFIFDLKRLFRRVVLRDFDRDLDLHPCFDGVNAARGAA
jgi:hypothetical protein